jgi:hypothetical protein
LCFAGFATVETDTARIGEQTIEVELVMITAAGLRAIEGSKGATQPGRDGN